MFGLVYSDVLWSLRIGETAKVEHPNKTSQNRAYNKHMENTLGQQMVNMVLKIQRIAIAALQVFRAELLAGLPDTQRGWLPKKACTSNGNALPLLYVGNARGKYSRSWCMRVYAVFGSCRSRMSWGATMSSRLETPERPEQLDYG